MPDSRWQRIQRSWVENDATTLCILAVTLFVWFAFIWGLGQ